MVKASELDQKATPGDSDSVVVVDRSSNPISSKRVPISAIRPRSIGALPNVAGTSDSTDPNNNLKVLLNDPRISADQRWRDVIIEGRISNNSVLEIEGAGIRDGSIFNAQLNAGQYPNIRGIGVQNQDLNMNLRQIVGLGDPVGPRNAATKSYVDTAISGVSSGGGGGAASLGALNNVPAGADTTETFVQYLRKAPATNQWMLSRGVPAADVQGTLPATAVPTLDIGTKTSGTLPRSRISGPVYQRTVLSGNVSFNFDADVNLFTFPDPIATYSFSLNNTATGNKKTVALFNGPFDLIGASHNLLPAFATAFADDSMNHAFNANNTNQLNRLFTIENELSGSTQIADGWLKLEVFNDRSGHAVISA